MKKDNAKGVENNHRKLTVNICGIGQLQSHEKHDKDDRGTPGKQGATIVGPLSFGDDRRLLEINVWRKGNYTFLHYYAMAKFSKLIKILRTIEKEVEL